MDGNENEFVNDIEEKLREKLPSNYILQKNANLFYQITLDNNLQPMVNFDEYPRRGHSAFQTEYVFSWPAL
jgi:hypothetical protein